MAGKKASKVEVDALRHQDMRKNIPTNELRDFAGDDELNPTPIRYPRDPSLDPQLVWNGKDEQDGEDLIVSASPIYIQEKIQPQAIIEEVRKQAAANESATAAPQQMELFSDFNGIEFEQMIEFYQHEQHWSNRMILGDSLRVMTSLAEKEGLKGRVQMIYIDPPYGIKFGSNWQVSTRKRDVKDGREEDLVRQPEQVRAFRDTWEKGIHSYLSYLRDRLVLARELLTESGSVFVQIGDENVHLVRNLLDEVFGSENFISQIVYRTKNMTFGGKYLETINDFILWYGKNKGSVKYHQLFRSMDTTGDSHWNLMEMDDGIRAPMLREQIDNHELMPSNAVHICQLEPFYPAGVNKSGLFTFSFRGKKYSPPQGKSWKTNEKGMKRVISANRVEPYQDGQTVRYVLKSSDYPVSTIPSLWIDTAPPIGKIYVVQTNSKVIERCMLMTSDPGDLVLDPTMGSGTTVYVAEQWGRRWITIDTSRVALALARTRLMSARYPFYTLADSPEGAEEEAKLTGIVPQPRRYQQDVKQGFVYERVPHIKLGDIARNEEIDVIHERWQSHLDERREWLNAHLGTAWEEWEVPRELPDAPQDLQTVLAEYWQMRRERQTQIDESIQHNSEREILYDRPYEDRKRIRVTGPFTVESLSPHRILDPGAAEAAARRSSPSSTSSTYEQTVIDNLRVAGVQNTRVEERLKFDTLEPLANVWLQAAGTYTQNDQERHVAVSIGSEHGTVTARQIKQAAKEAVKGIGYDLLLVCGFAFDAHASEESTRYGNLNVQIVRMNPDLMMGDVLKQTERANLFTIFGEPDIVIEQGSDGKYVVEVRGLDIYDPTTGQIRNSSIDDIACWFLDTAYNDESFFVRHAYFLGKDDAYDNLKRALKAEIDESAWQMLYSARSMPFERPESGRVAVKVINHYGDEVLKVYTL